MNTSVEVSHGQEPDHCGVGGVPGPGGAGAKKYGVSPAWVSTLVSRYRSEGPAAFEPRSKRPHTNAKATPSAVEDRIIELRKELLDIGTDAGAEKLEGDFLSVAEFDSIAIGAVFEPCEDDAFLVADAVPSFSAIKCVTTGPAQFVQPGVKRAALDRQRSP